MVFNHSCMSGVTVSLEVTMAFEGVTMEPEGVTMALVDITELTANPELVTIILLWRAALVEAGRVIGVDLII